MLKLILGSLLNGWTYKGLSLLSPLLLGFLKAR